MSKLRIFAVSLFSIGLAFSSFGGFGSVKVAGAVDAAPTLTSVVAKNTGGTSAKEAGDTIVLVFSEATNKFAITAANIDNLLHLNNTHSFKDGAGAIGATAWNTTGTELTYTLSAGTTLPTVVVGDTVTIAGTSLKDVDGNDFTGAKVITGSFTATTTGTGNCEMPTVHTSESGSGHGQNMHPGDSGDNADRKDDCDDHGSMNHACNNAVVNGKLYKIGTGATVYLAVHCTLKPFRGAAVFHARGAKFSDIIMLTALPAGVTMSTAPALPVEGTLVKGTNKTVWFISHMGMRRGFVSSDVFTKLGFKFEKVKEISDSDLSELPTDTANVSDGDHHPDGSLIKCGNSAAVFLIVGGKRKQFASAEVFEGRGHSFEHVLNVDCGRFAYGDDSAVTDVE